MTWTSVRVTAGYAGERLASKAAPGHEIRCSETFLPLACRWSLVLTGASCCGGNDSEIAFSKSTVFTRRSFWFSTGLLADVAASLGGVVFALFAFCFRQVLSGFPKSGLLGVVNIDCRSGSEMECVGERHANALVDWLPFTAGVPVPQRLWDLPRFNASERCQLLNLALVCRCLIVSGLIVPLADELLSICELLDER